MMSTLLSEGDKANDSVCGNSEEGLPDYVKPNRREAQKFFLSTLPRRIADSNQRTGHRLAKPGEMKDSVGNSSFMYPLSTSDDALSEFGIGIGLYFHTVKLLFGVLLICACFSLIALNHNSEFNPSGTLFQLQGSVYGATRADLKLNHQGVSDIMCCIVICLFTVLSNFMEKKIVTKIDTSQQTTQDYSVECTNPPLNCMDMDVYYNFFSKFGEVVLISIATTNGELLASLADRKSVEGTLQGLISAADQELSLQTESPANVDRNSDAIFRDTTAAIESAKYDSVPLTFLQKVGLAPTIKSCFKKLKRLNIDIDHLCTEEYEPWRVFVTFNSEFSQRHCLRKTNVGKFSVFMNKVDNDEVLLYGKTLNIVEASEPNDVIYETSHRNLLYRATSWLLSYFCCGIFLVGSFFVIETLSGNGNVLVAIFISLVNAMLPPVIKSMTLRVEVHVTERDVQKSMLLKLVIGRCINSAILIYVATNYSETFGEGSLLQMQNILIADAVTTPLIRLMNVYDNVMRYLVVPHYARTQEAYNAAWQGAEWNLAERYTDMLKTVFVGLFFLVPLPSGLFISSFAMLTTYLVDKYSLFRLWRRSPDIDHSLGTLSRYFLVIVVFCHLAISRVYFANWPYDDGGDKAKCNFFICDTDNSDMTTQQKEIVNVYSGFSVAMFVVAVAWGILYKVYMGFQQFYHGKVHEVGDASPIPFTSVPNLEGYCPNVQRSDLPSPLLCADIDRVPSTYIPLRKAAADGFTVDSNDFSLYNFSEFSREKVDTPEKLAALFGQMKCFNSAAPAVRGVLPSGWERKRTDDGREYFVDHDTKTTHWALPKEYQQQQPGSSAMSPGDTSVKNRNITVQSPLPAGWEQKQCPSGRVYYADHSRRLTQWERPLN